MSDNDGPCPGHEERIGFVFGATVACEGDSPIFAPRTAHKVRAQKLGQSPGFAAALLFVLVCLLAAEARGDNRPTFVVEYGECDEALEQWGRAALFAHFEGPVWEDFAERDGEVVVVSEACRFYNVDDPKLCVRIVVKNPGWRGHRGDRAKIQWQPDRWFNGEDAGFKLVQLRTNVRANYGPRK